MENMRTKELKLEIEKHKDKNEEHGTRHNKLSKLA